MTNNEEPIVSEIKALRRVSAYSTSDGLLHKTRPAAERHQARLDIVGWIDSMPALATVDKEAVADLMVEGGHFLIDRLRQVLKADPKPKGAGDPEGA